MPVCLIFTSSVVLGQNITIQQPSISNFSVGTTVSVPDRGGAYLGGVGRSASSRTSFGFGPFGRNVGIGREQSHGGMSTHVYIHDFAEMDRQLLGESSRSKSYPLNGAAGHAYYSLNGRSPKLRQGIAAERRRAVSNSVSAEATDLRKAKAYYQLGLKAAARGKDAAARLHFEKAAAYGSMSATEELAGLRETRVSSP